MSRDDVSRDDVSLSQGISVGIISSFVGDPGARGHCKLLEPEFEKAAIIVTIRYYYYDYYYY